MTSCLALALAGVLALGPVSGTKSASPDTASLTVSNRTITVFRAPLGAAGPGERALAAGRRIEAAISAGGGTVETRSSAEGTLFLVGGRPVFSLLPADADTAAGESMPARISAASLQLQTAVAESLEARSVSVLLAAIGLSLLATIIAGAAIRIVIWGHRRARVWILLHVTLPESRTRGFTLLARNQSRRMLLALTTSAAWVLGAVIAYLHVTFVLTRFAWTRPWGERLGDYMVDLGLGLLIGFLHALPGLLAVAIIMLAARYVTIGLQAIFRAVEAGTLVLPGVHVETAQPTRRIVSFLVWLFALVIAYPYLPGSDSAVFKGVSVFAGLLLTLSSAGLVSQAMSGLVLMYSRAFRVGDFVRIGETQGTIVELALLSTRVRTTKNELVTFPSAAILTGPVTNYSADAFRSGPLLLYSSVTIGYDVDWRTVHKLLLDAARETEETLDEPAPYVLQRALNDWHVEYQVNVALSPSKAAAMPAIYSRLHAAIQDAFRDAGVEIMSPSYLALRDGAAPALPGLRPAQPAGS